MRWRLKARLAKWRERFGARASGIVCHGARARCGRLEPKLQTELNLPRRARRLRRRGVRGPGRRRQGRPAGRRERSGRLSAALNDTTAQKRPVDPLTERTPRVVSAVKLLRTAERRVRLKVGEDWRASLCRCQWNANEGPRDPNREMTEHSPPGPGVKISPTFDHTPTSGQYPSGLDASRQSGGKDHRSPGKKSQMSIRHPRRPGFTERTSREKAWRQSGLT